MSFGLKKTGANNTDKKLIARYVAAQWPVDKISSKLSIEADVVERVIKAQGGKAAKAAKPAAKEPAKEKEAS
jgi:ethanolamine utilization protein EutQ (cupin superfamily)